MTRYLLFTGVAAALGVCAAAQASADELCISPRAVESVTACAGAPKQVELSTRHPLKLGAVAPAPGAPRDPTKAPPPSGGAGAPEIRRGERSKPAGGPVVSGVTAIQQLETLFAATPSNSPDRAKLMKRLADEYVELESSAFRRKIEARTQAGEVKQRDPRGSAAALAEADKAEKIEGAARQAAIKYYGLLKTQYPRWCQMPSSVDPAKSQGCGDEVLYYLAYEHEQANQPDQARKAYLELVQGFPASRYVPSAYLAFGELFFNEAQGDPTRWGLAEQSYKEVVKYPAPENKVLGYARYKLAYVYWNKGDFAQALSELKKTIDLGTQFPTMASARQITSAARHDILPLYALAGEPTRAHDFIRPLSGDTGAQTEGTYRMMDELGQAYLDIGNYRSAVALYRDLMGRDEGPKSCSYQSHLSEATLALKSGDKQAIKQELDHQLEAYQRAVKKGHPAEIIGKCGSVTADLLVETAMAFHLEAQGSGGVRGTGNKETMALAAQLYDMASKSFSAEQWKGFEFPRIVKEDWPTPLKIKYQRADLLYFQRDWASCGPAFDAVVAEDPSGPLAAESAYAALLCYQEVYHQSHQGRSDRAGLAAAGQRPGADLAPQELDAPEKAMIGAFDRYLCCIKPAASDREGKDRLVDVKYARARIYFENHRWEEAALAFRDVALNHADADAGVYAAQLSLEALNVLGSNITPARPACYDEMSRDVPRYMELYCSAAMRPENAESCASLARVECDLQRSTIDAMMSKSDQGAAAGYERVATAYLEFWNKRGKQSTENKLPTCGNMDQVLHNAARAFQAAHLLAKAISVRKILIDPRYNLDKGELGRKAVRDIGQNYQAIAVYDEAASYYERYARESPAGERAAESLQDAVLLRLGLGQEKQALDDAELFEKSHGAKQPALSAQIAFAIGAHDAEHGDVQVAKKRLLASMRSIDRSAPLDVQIVAHALLGKVLAQTGDPTGAGSEYARVKAAYRDPAALIKGLEEAGKADGERRLGRVLAAVGEAEFFSAEQKRKEVERIRFPEYKGSGRRDDVERHIATRVMAWMKQKQPAIEAAEKSYLAIEAIQPVPPPAWMIAAGSRVGQMWGRFVAEFRAAPIPREWLQHGPSPYGDLSWDEIRAAYYERIDLVSEPYRKRAKAAYEACLRYSVKYQFFDEHSRSCEVWLSKTYGAEYHLIDELKASPSWVGSPLEGAPAQVELSPLVSRRP
jgi:TolA-binding protein